jgi:hypothetical protein
MFRIFKLTPFSGGDRLFVWNKFEESYNLIGLIVCDRLDTEGLKKIFIERESKYFLKCDLCRNINSSIGGGKN